MTREIIDTVAKYVIAAIVVGSCFYVIATNPSGDNTQPWSVITLIVGWLIRDSAGNSSAANTARIAAAAAPVVITGEQANA